MKLISEKEADVAIHTTYADCPVWFRVAQAQRDACEKELKERLDKLTMLSDVELLGLTNDLPIIAGLRASSNKVLRARKYAQATIDDVKRKVNNG